MSLLVTALLRTAQKVLITGQQSPNISGYKGCLYPLLISFNLYCLAICMRHPVLTAETASMRCRKSSRRAITLLQGRRNTLPVLSFLCTTRCIGLCIRYVMSCCTISFWLIVATSPPSRLHIPRLLNESSFAAVI